MRIRILMVGSMMGAMSGLLAAADPQIMNLVMPDAKVISGINVAHVTVTPFGKYVLTQLSTSSVEQLTALTGFDPSKDLNELLCASNGTQNTGLALAMGTFDPAKIGALVAKDGAVTETYRSITILENPAKTDGVAFLSATVLVAGDVADVKAAIDRQLASATLPASLAGQISALSGKYDAWAFTTVPPSSLSHGTATNPPGEVGGVTVPANVLSLVTSGQAGILFGSNITVTALAQTADATTATNLANMLQLLQNLALMQAQQNANLGALANSVTITATEQTVNILATLSEDQFQALVQEKPRAAHKRVH